MVAPPQMPADGLTNAELAKTDTLVHEQATIEQRSEQPHLKLQSRSAAEKTRQWVLPIREGSRG